MTPLAAITTVFGFGWILLVALGTTGYTFCDSQAQRAMADAAEAAGIAVSKPALSLAYYSFRAVELCHKNSLYDGRRSAIIWVKGSTSPQR